MGRKIYTDGVGDQKPEGPRRPAIPPKAPRLKFADARFETCKYCGIDWNISAKAVIDPNGYLCPRCRDKRRREQ